MPDGVSEQFLETFLDQLSALNSAVHGMDDRNRENHDIVIAKINDLNVRTSVLEVKSGLWGAVGGMVSTAIAVGALWLKGLVD